MYSALGFTHGPSIQVNRTQPHPWLFTHRTVTRSHRFSLRLRRPRCRQQSRRIHGKFIVYFELHRARGRVSSSFNIYIQIRMPVFWACFLPPGLQIPLAFFSRRVRTATRLHCPRPTPQFSVLASCRVPFNFASLRQFSLTPRPGARAAFFINHHHLPTSSPIPFIDR